MTRQDILRAMTQFRNHRAAEFGITRIGFFGSVARGDISEGSDVDVVVEVTDPDLFTLVGIKQELEQLLHCSVDLVRYRDGMNAFLKQRIDQEAAYV